MNVSLNAYTHEAGAEILKALRAPEFIVPTLALPVAFYALFGIAMADSSRQAQYMLATYGVFAVMGPAIFGFGAGVANERDRGWLNVKRAAPAPATSYIAAKLTATLVFASAALFLIYAVGGLMGGVELASTTWLSLYAVHMLCAIPFVLIGLTLGFSFAANGAIAMSNIVFLFMAALGGLWLPVFLLPEFLQQFANFLPSYHLSEIALWAVDAPGEHTLLPHLPIVLVMTGVLLALALFAWARQRA